MRFSVRDVIYATGVSADSWEAYRALCTLADDLNSSLLHYEVTLEHHDTGDFLRFEKREPQEIPEE